jgi:cytochrome c-type biogenesis protein
MNILAAIHATLAAGGLLALPAAFVGGFITALNPCCLAIYPAAAATCSAVREEQKTSLPAAFGFVGGLALATARLGMLAATAGRALTELGGWVAYAVAIVPLAAGAHLLGWLRLPTIRARTGGAFLTGFLLSLVIAPCGTPLLASILSFAAYRGSVAYGGVLLFVYGIGASVPVLLLGATTAKIAVRLDRSGLRACVDRATASYCSGWVSILSGEH